MSRWLCLGCGPSMDAIPPEAMCDNIATCNRGIDVFPAPRVYCMIEREIIWTYKDKYIEAKKNGTHVVTMDKVQAACRVDADEVVPVVGPKEFDVLSWVPGEYRNACTAGSLLVQWVANHGATEINLVGYDGYSISEGSMQRVKSTLYQGPLLTRMAEVLPDVQFIFWSRPNYEVADLPNVIVHELEPAQSCG